MDPRELIGAAGGLGIALSDGQAQRMLAYMECVLASDRANVTAIKDPARGARLHLLDSLCAVPALSAAPEGRFVDLGTGGGFPGVPLSIATDRPVVLLDGVRKKAELVQECADITAALPAGSYAVGLRSEEFAAEHPGEFSACVARAVADMPALLELCRPLVALGGRLILMKGPLGPDELERSARVAELIGVELRSEDRFTLPDGAEERRIYSFEVVEPSGVDLPRRPGRATKKPLA